LRDSVAASNVEIVSFEGLLADYTRNNDINVVIRGLRAVSDFEYEFQMALTNRKLNSNLETVFLSSKEEFTYLSTSMVKTIAQHKGNVLEFVPESVARALYTQLERH
jgi:pantetheine-phosphate adenylyltransferase